MVRVPDPHGTTSTPTAPSEELGRALDAGSRGNVDAMRSGLLTAFHMARDVDDRSTMAAAALAMPRGQGFGTHPGYVPALLHEAFEVVSDPALKAQLAAALARSWVYGGSAPRAVDFADISLALAEGLGDADLLAGALDAALLARWGPDDLPLRLGFAARLEDVAAHLSDPEARMNAHLWQLTIAWERLDRIGIHRRLKALSLLSEEAGTARAAFYATSRWAMHALATADDATDDLIDETRRIGDTVGEPDAAAVIHSLDAGRALQRDDVATIRTEAAAFEEFGEAEAVPSILAEAAVLWAAADELDRAVALVNRIAGPDLATVPRDVDFLLTTCCILDVAAVTSQETMLRTCVDALSPYAGRAVLNAGAVTFHGVVDDHIWRALRALGDDGATGWKRSAAAAYRRVGASPWIEHLDAPPTTPHRATTVVHLRKQEGPSWTVGRDGATFSLPDLRGLAYLRLLLERPHRTLSASALSDAVAGHPGIGTREDHLGEVLDHRALGDYRRRLGALEEEFEEAVAWSDTDRREKLMIEKEAILRELSAAAGISGRPRRPGSSDEHARIAVRKAISTTIARVADHDAWLGRVLVRTIRTGSTCSYDPDPDQPLTWVLDRRTAASPSLDGTGDTLTT